MEASSGREGWAGTGVRGGFGVQEVEVRTELIIEVFGLPVQGTRGDAPFSMLRVLTDA